MPHLKTTRPTVVFDRSAACRCYSPGVAGDVITKILDSGLGITAMMGLTMDEADAGEFLQVYKDVVQEYPLMVSELSSGFCIAMEVCGPDAQRVARELAGPPDPVWHRLHKNLFARLINEPAVTLMRLC